MVQVVAAAAITGIAFVQVTQGAYTADNTNQVGLYSYAAGTLTLIPSSTNNGNLWKQPRGTFKKEPFSAAVDVTPGVYFLGFLWNNSAPGITPTIAAAAPSVDGVTAVLDLPLSGKTYGVLLAQTNLPASQAMSGINSTGAHPWLALY
jgi:hypothetical protein